MKVSFIISGDPFGWQRTGTNRKTGAIYIPEKTRRQEELVALAYRAQCGGVRFPTGVCLAIRIIAYMRIPRSVSKKKREKMLSGEIRPTVKPDWDNLGKLISDALNGIAYDDDKCIVDAAVCKFYASDPRTAVVIQEAKIP